MIVEALYLDLEDLEQQSESGKEKKKKKNSVTWQDLKKGFMFCVIIINDNRVE